MKKVVIIILNLLVMSVFTLAQTSVNIGSQSTITGCDLYIYDDGGASGHYGPSHNYTLTIYPSANQGRVAIEILTIDIHQSDTLYIYDGATTSGTQLAALNNSTYSTSLYNNTVMATENNASGALTLRFKTSSFSSTVSNHGAGFQLHTSCASACNPFQIVLDTAHCSHIPYLNPSDQYYYIDLCPDEALHLAVNGVYSSSSSGGYVQRDGTSHFTWQLEANTQQSGTGMDSVTHLFTSGMGHEVIILAIDTLFCPAQQPITFRVRTSDSPIKTLHAMPQLCTGQTFTPSISYDNNSHIVLQEVGYTLPASLEVHDTVFLPDGENCPPYGLYYRSNVTFTNFAPNATLTNANDILYVRIKMEHSAIEDLKIDIFCPNGSSSTILPHPNLNYGWHGDDFLFRVNLGSAYRPDGGSCNASLNPMGNPWNYVWSNNTTLGYQYAAANGGFFDPANIHSHYNGHWDNSNFDLFGDNTHSYSVDSTNVAAMTQVYHPYQSFNSLVGCPLNGNWYIQVQDLYQEDNGYLVEWELALNPQLLPSQWDYTVTVDSLYFTGNQVISGTTLQPQEAGDQPFVLNVIDDFGCHYDTTVTITVHETPEVELGGRQALCDGQSITLGADSSFNNHVYHWSTGAHTPQITVNTPGIYSLTASLMSGFTTLCQSSDTVEVVALESSNSILNDVVCAGRDYAESGFELSANTLAGSETYTATRTLTAENGCDSIVTLNLTILPKYEVEIEKRACEQYVWEGETYTESGEYVMHYTSVDGCDSTLTLRLSIGHPEENDVDVISCGSYDWAGETLSESGDYEKTFFSSHECDSLVRLHLTVLDTALTASESNPDFCTTMESVLSVEGDFDNYVWNTGETTPFITITQSGLYSVTASNYACERVKYFQIPNCPLILYIPNAITPSKADGLNDVLHLSEYSQRMIGDFSISIFNRWGELVYLSNDKNFTWDGRKDGKLMVDTIYSYLIICTDRDGKSHRLTGFVTVL